MPSIRQIAIIILGVSLTMACNGTSSDAGAESGADSSHPVSPNPATAAAADTGTAQVDTIHLPIHNAKHTTTAVTTANSFVIHVDLDTVTARQSASFSSDLMAFVTKDRSLTRTGAAGIAPTSCYAIFQDEAEKRPVTSSLDALRYYTQKALVQPNEKRYFPLVDLPNHKLNWVTSKRRSNDKGINYSVEFLLNSRSIEKLRKSKGDWELIWKTLDPKILFFQDYDGVADINLTTTRLSQAEKSGFAPPSAIAPVDLSWLTPDDFGMFYVFDIFGQPCWHGEKVYDVVRQVLNYYKLDSVFEHKVRTVPINYFSNQSFGDDIIKTWYNKPGIRGIDASAGKPVSQAILDSLNGRNDKTPLIYLEALFKVYSDSLPDIISSSFTINCIRPFANLAFAKNNISTNYITAAPNDPTKFAEFYCDSYDVSGRGQIYLEPIQSFCAQKRKYGVVVVGDQIADDQYGSAISKTGNVDLLGKGTTWGLPNCTHCITIKDTGTSFATPEVATLLYIAKAVWKKKDNPANPLEARTRMLLSADLNTAFVDKFAAGGMINMNKLLVTQNGFLVTLTGEVVPIEKLISGKVQLKNDKGAVIYDYDFAKGDRPDLIRGFYYLGTQPYVFLNSSGTWTPLPQSPGQLSILYKAQGELKSLDLDNFAANYQELVLF